MYELLARNPQCYIPISKDLYFFDRYYSRGKEWYYGKFKGASSHHKAVGELSHDYLFDTNAAGRILECLGSSVKVFCCLRNPIERTFSHYLYLRRKGLVSESLQEAVAGRWGQLVENSMYGEHLPRYVNTFPSENFRIFLFDDLVGNSAYFAEELQRYLGLQNCGYIPGVTRGAATARNQLLSRFVTHTANKVRDWGMDEIVGILKRGPLQRILYREYGASGKPKLNNEDRSWLRGLFMNDYTKYRALLPRPVDHWFDQE